MLGPGVYFAMTPEDTCGKAQHGQPNAMMLECYVFTGDMEEVQRGSFTQASGSDTVYFSGFKGRPEFVVKDSRRICTVCAYKCDPSNGSRVGPLDEEARRSRLQWAQTVWRDTQLHAERSVDLRGGRMENAMERIERRGRAKKKDRKQLNSIFKEFAGAEGTLNRAQLYNLLCAIGMPPDNNKGALQAIFEELDTKGNGKVTKKEFRKGIIRRAKHGDFDFDSDDSDG